MVNLYGDIHLHNAPLELILKPHGAETLLIKLTMFHRWNIIISIWKISKFIIMPFWKCIFQMSTLAFCKFFQTFFAQSRVFRTERVHVAQNSCLILKEHTLTFSKHQKLLESNKYSWWNLNFSDGVDYFYMVTRILDGSDVSLHVAPMHQNTGDNVKMIDSIIKIKTSPWILYRFQ